ncbi:MAG TPA: UDP-N-acetylmuramate--L-alanine ligase [Candidatus Omnitrophota bacterium]|nr:UDP-N-acetylmuramate--L-alanine ligase [Candidatus Omnitrophota bacterium]
MNKHYHFIGIGGIGMGALAALSLDKGCSVSGSDLRSNQVTERLKERGAVIYTGHRAENVQGADCVVFSSAIRSDNPELAEAHQRKIPVMQRAKLLAELMEGYIGITVAGAHGKTTTTSMIANLLVRAGLQPTTAIGGIVTGTQAHAELGTGKYFVTEVDESDGSFLYFKPRYSVITNIDFEHVDFYHDWQTILDTYRRFIRRTEEDGVIFAYGEDERLMDLLQKSGRPYKTYGFSDQHDVYASNISFDHFESQFDVFINGENSGRVILKVPGRHNVANALACISVGLELSVDFNVIKESFKGFWGVQRRFQLKGQANDVWVIDDYAHHPTEIRATLEAAQSFKRSLEAANGKEKARKLIAIFQPHRYSRVQGLLEEFAASLAGSSDHVIITDIYAASEKPIEGVTSERIHERIRLLTDKPSCYLPKDRIVDYVLDIVKPRDIVITLGAGDITRISDDLLEALKSSPAVADKIL